MATAEVDSSTVGHTIMPMNIPMPPNLKLETNLPNNWKVWRQLWDNYSIVAMLEQQSEKYQIATFLTAIGQDAIVVYNALPLSDVHRKKLCSIIDAFEKYAIGDLNDTYERYVFNSRDQHADENIDAYVTTLRTLAKTCKFCDCLNETLLRDRIVVGIRNNQVRKKLLQVRDLTLVRCIDICRSSEATESHLKVMNSEMKEDVHRVDRRVKKSRVPGSDKSTWSTSRSDEINCRYCGFMHVRDKTKCPAYGKSCKVCGQRNHFAKRCSKKKSSYAVYEHCESDDEHIAVIKADSVRSVNPPRQSSNIYAQMEIGRKIVTFQIDSGASVNILPDRMLDPSLHVKMMPTSTVLQMWNHVEVKPVGAVRISVRNPANKRRYSIEFMIVKDSLDDQLQPIIGSRAAIQMNIITVNECNFKKAHVKAVKPCDQSSVPRTSHTVIEQYPDVFDNSKLGCMPGLVRLEVTEDAIPSVQPARRVPVALKSVLKKKLDELVNSEVITKVDHPTDWVSAMAIATKRNGDIRICIDPRPLNKYLKREHYQMPTIDDVLPSLRNAKVFSTVDAASGFWQLRLDDKSSDLTTFDTPYGRYKWLRLPFGISPSPEIFQKRLHQCIEGVPGVLCVADDIMIYGCGDDIEAASADHDKNLAALLSKCRENGVKLNPDKLQLKCKSITYLGHVITDDGLKPDPAKVEAVLAMPKPGDVKAIQRFNGFINYLAKFLPKLSDMMRPLRELTHIGIKWSWSTVHDNAFASVKQMITNAPVLRYYSQDEELTLQCDSSEYGLGASMLQDGQPVAFASRGLIDSETRWAQIEKELLSIVFGLERFNQYTYGRHVNIESDHT